MANEQVREIQFKQRSGSEGQNWMLNLSPAKMAILMTLAIFFAELCVMLLLDRLPAFTPLVEAVIDSSFLIVFLVPVYIVFYRPFWKSRQQAQKDIRQLNHRLIEATEAERRRVALDLHDHCDQTLVALQKTVELVQSKIIDSNEEAAVLCQEIDELLGRLNSDVRTVSAAMYPPQFEEQGLGAALRQHILQLQARNSGVIIEFLEKGSAYPLDKQKSISIYRIAQDAVKNAIQHSAGKLIRVYLDYTPDIVAVSVVDNGKGFHPKKTCQSGGIGLIGIRERAKAYGGTVAIHSEVGRGTSLRVSFKD